MIGKACRRRQGQRSPGAAGSKQEQGADDKQYDTHDWNPKTGLQC